MTPREHLENSCRLRPQRRNSSWRATACSPVSRPWCLTRSVASKARTLSGLQTDVRPEGRADALLPWPQPSARSGPVLVEVHRVCHRCAPVAEELLPVLGAMIPTEWVDQLWRRP